MVLLEKHVEKVEIFHGGGSLPSLNELVGVLKAMAIVRLVGYQIVFRLLLCFLDRVQGVGGHNMRDRATIRRLNMYRQKERR